jgi:hypothetical protein
MLHGRGRGANRWIAGSPRILAATTLAAMALALADTESAIADTRLSLFTFQIVKSFNASYGKQGGDDARPLWTLFPALSTGRLLFSGGQGDPTMEPLDQDSGLGRGPGFSVPGFSSVIRSGLSSFAAGFPETSIFSAALYAGPRALARIEVDPAAAGNRGTAAPLGLVQPALEVEPAYRFEGTDLAGPGGDAAAAPVLAAAAVTDLAAVASMPTPLRILAMVLESFAIVVCGSRVFIGRPVPALRRR